MRILFIVDRSAWPPESGTDLRLIHVLAGLQRAGTVTTALVRPGRLSADRLEAMRRATGELVVVGGESEAFRGRAWRVEESGGVGAMLPPSSREVLAGLRRRHDIVWIERLGLASRCGIDLDPAAIVDLDDLNQQKYALAAKHTRRWTGRLRFGIAAFRWKQREKAAHRRYGRLAVCSGDDRRILGDHANIAVIPNGYERLPAHEPVRQNRLGFIGTLEYWANRDGLQWFLDKVWPGIRSNHPMLEFRIAGKGRRDSDVDRPGVRWLGFVADAAEEISSWSAMVVPLRIGAGTRIKILEAFSRRCPVIATSVGAYGLEVVSGEHLILADTPREIVAGVSRLVSDPKLQERLATQAYHLFDRTYAWDRIEDQITRLAGSMVLTG